MQGWEKEDSGSHAARTQSCSLQSWGWQRAAGLHGVSEPGESLARGSSGISRLPEPARDAPCLLASTSLPRAPFPQPRFPAPHRFHPPCLQDGSSASIPALLSHELHLLLMGEEAKKKGRDGNYSFCSLGDGKGAQARAGQAQPECPVPARSPKGQGRSPPRVGMG